ncbi:MAG TPA: hypothetical protein VFR13_09295 [Jiangellaceae bacterium]|nr:hypothetical protein [Jiangellaceae bacterium]
MRRFFAAMATVLAVTVGLAAPADAGNSTLRSGAFTQPAGGPCGSSYTHIGHYPIRSTVTVGYLDVYWSWTAKRNCLVTNHAGPTYGVRTYTEARIRPSGFSWPHCPSSTGCDGGLYRYYAGPVYTPAGVDMTNRCIDVSGWVDWVSRTLSRIHCG